MLILFLSKKYQRTINAFNILVEQVVNCPQLFFMNDKHKEVVLYTDASDYGIGVYLTQTDENDMDIQ